MVGRVHPVFFFCIFMGGRASHNEKRVGMGGIWAWHSGVGGEFWFSLAFWGVWGGFAWLGAALENPV